MASTKKGSTTLVFRNPDEFRQIVKALDGDLIIEIKQLSDCPTRKQWYYFREVVIPKFVKLAANAGTGYEKDNAIQVLLGEVGGLDLLDFFVSDEFNEGLMSKSAVSGVIGQVEVWINEFFG